MSSLHGVVLHASRPRSASSSLHLHIQLLLLSLLPFSSAAATGSHAKELSGSSFEHTVRHSKLLLVKFYVPWCAYCKKVEPEFERAALDLADLESKGVKVGKVDVSKETQLGQRYKITGYPSILVFFDGKVNSHIEYRGETTAEEIAGFVHRLADRPAVHHPSSKNELESIVSRAKKEKAMPVVAFLAPEEKEIVRTFDHLAKKHRGSFTFVQGGAELAKEVGVTHPHVYTELEGKAVYNGDYSEDELDDFIVRTSFPLFGEMTPGPIFESYAARGIPIAWLFTDDSGASAAAKDEVKTLAAQFKGLSFVWIDGIKYSPMMEQLGLLQHARLPAFAIEDGSKHYAYSGKVVGSSLSPWLDKFVKQELKPTVRSQPESTGETGALRTLVGSTFAKAIAAKTDLLVLFHAPWCSHCQALKPAYTELARKFEKTSLTVAIMDTTANDVSENYEKLIEGYPTLLLFVKGGSTPTVHKFTGERTVAALTAFVQRYSVALPQGEEDADEL